MRSRDRKDDGRNLPVHKVIQAKLLTAALPDRFQMRKLTAACGIIFPEEPQLCLHVALRGWCPFHHMCKKKHDPSSLVTDAMAENVINLFEPFIKNPKILLEGKYN